MCVVVKCERTYDKPALKAIMESCGCCPPPEPQCPPMCRVTCPPAHCGPPPPLCPVPPFCPRTPCCPPSPCPTPPPCCPPPRKRLDNCCNIPVIPPAGVTSPVNFGRCTPSTPIPCMTCPPLGPIPPCPPCPFICPPCTGYPCVTCAPIPKPVPAPCEPIRPVVRTPINTGGLFYVGTTKCYPCLPPICSPAIRPYSPIAGMSVTC